MVDVKFAEQHAPGAPGEDVATPSPFYCTGEEFLRVSSFGSVVSVELTLRTRFLDALARLVPSADRHVPNSNRTIATTDHPLGDGWLMGAEIHASVGSPRVGQVFVVVDLMRGSGAAAVVLQTLIQGYVTDTSRLGWPGSLIWRSTDGRGVLRAITGTDPAAGVEIIETVPTNARWLFHAITFTLVTSATVANREVNIAFDDGANVFARSFSGTNQAATNTVIYSGFHTTQRGAAASTGIVAIPLPRIPLQGGFRVRTITTAIDAGDNYGAPQYLVEEWIED
jgi:hypothetical protein